MRCLEWYVSATEMGARLVIVDDFPGRVCAPQDKGVASTGHKGLGQSPEIGLEVEIAKRVSRIAENVDGDIAQLHGSNADDRLRRMTKISLNLGPAPERLAALLRDIEDVFIVGVPDALEPFPVHGFPTFGITPKNSLDLLCILFRGRHVCSPHPSWATRFSRVWLNASGCSIWYIWATSVTICKSALGMCSARIR